MDAEQVEQDAGRSKREERFVVDEPLLLKAEPRTEGDRRFIYCEPSNENVDAQRERLLQQALADSAPLFLRFGVLDLDHKSLLGERMGMSAAQARSYVIGAPVDVRTQPRILVKGEIYRGDAPHLENANFFWSTLTEQSPPARWYPSVGGRTLHRRPDGTIDQVEWVNLAFAQQPVNRDVPAVQVLPFEAFCKAVTAGYGTDVATLTGGQATQTQSIQRGLIPYRELGGRYMKAVGTGKCEHTWGKPTLPKMVAHFRDCEHLTEDQAKACAARLIFHVARHVRKDSTLLKEAA